MAVKLDRAVRFQHTAARRRLLETSSINADPVSGFNTQPPEGGCFIIALNLSRDKVFQHTAARRRLLSDIEARIGSKAFQHTAARRRLPPEDTTTLYLVTVSTHSRPKAAANIAPIQYPIFVFQHTAARRRLLNNILTLPGLFLVSTHSRPKAAAEGLELLILIAEVSTHSRPKAAAKCHLC